MKEAPGLWNGCSDSGSKQLSADLPVPLLFLRLLVRSAERHPPSGPPLSVGELAMFLQQHLPLGNAGRFG